MICHVFIPNLTSWTIYDNLLKAVSQGPPTQVTTNKPWNHLPHLHPKPGIIYSLGWWSQGPSTQITNNNQALISPAASSSQTWHHIQFRMMISRTIYTDNKQQPSTNIICHVFIPNPTSHTFRTMISVNILRIIYTGNKQQIGPNIICHVFIPNLTSYTV